MTARNYAFDTDGVDADTVYTTCPVCGIVSPAASLEYTLLPGGDLNPAYPFRTGCTPGQHHYEATYQQILARDTEATCIAGPGWNRPDPCGHRFTVPAAADEICCPQCGVHQPGPAAADPARAALVARSAAQFAAYARDILDLVRHQDPPPQEVLSMAGRSRAGKVRAAAAALSTTHQVRFEATFTGGTRWDLRWTDGPTRDTVHQALSTMDTGGADISSYRHFSTTAVALAVIRAAAAGQNMRAIRWDSWSPGGLNWTLEDAHYPDRSIDAREEHMVVTLLAAATPPGRSHPDENQILRLVTDRGVAWLLGDGVSATDTSGSVVSPIEVLTARYAQAEAKWRWERQAKTMPAQAAVDAALADPAIDQAGALTLLVLLAQQRAQAAGRSRRHRHRGHRRGELAADRPSRRRRDPRPGQTLGDPRNPKELSTITTRTTHERGHDESSADPQTSAPKAPWARSANPPCMITLTIGSATT